jgi:amidase
MDRADLAFAGLSRHVDLIAAGELSSRALVELFLERIDRLDPLLNAFRVVLREQALAQADQADGRRRAGDRRPLLGVPIAIKDDLHVAGEVTAYGCDADAAPQPADHEVVRRLRAAGAVILGKTHVPELMATAFTESPTFGVTRNPWDPHRTPGGSSGGSAAAVAAGLASAALGTDGAGSIRIPAACCGLFGLKPQRGRVTTAPEVHPHRDMAVIGPLARTVEDAARLADVLKDAGPSYAEAAAAEPGRLRIAVSAGVPLPGLTPDAEQLAGMEATAAALRELGHTVAPRELDWNIALGNRVLARFVRGVGEMAMQIGHRDRLSRRARGMARIGMMIPSRLADAAGAQAAADAERINRIFDESDVVLTPMFTRRPLRVREYDGASGLRTLNGNVRFAPYAGAFNHTGQPAVSVPVATAGDGFPIGAQLVGPPDSEPRLIALAAQLERHVDWPARRPAL